MILLASRDNIINVTGSQVPAVLDGGKMFVCAVSNPTYLAKA